MYTALPLTWASTFGRVTVKLFFAGRITTLCRLGNALEGVHLILVRVDSRKSVSRIRRIRYDYLQCITVTFGGGACINYPPQASRLGAPVKAVPVWGSPDYCCRGRVYHLSSHGLTPIFITHRSSTRLCTLCG